MKRLQFLPLILASVSPLLHSHAADILVPDHFPTIQEAINSAKEGDRVLVSAGKYPGPVSLKAGITLQSEGNNSTGKLGLARAESTIIDGEGKTYDSPGVTLAEGAVLDGFTVTGFGKYDEAVWKQNWDEQGANQKYEHIGEFGQPGIGITGIFCTVKNNIVDHNGGTGIAIRGTDDGKITAPLILENVCYRNMGGGIGSLNHSTAIIHQNRCFENFFAGIGHDNANPIVTENECYGNIRAGIGISEGASPVVIKNRCYQNRRAGIGIRTGSNTRPVVEDNDCFENAMSGIGAEAKAEPIIRGNRCYRNEMAGIGCRTGASPVLIGNVCSENKLSGIGADSATPLIHKNECRGNQTAGIGISAGSSAVITENICSENKTVALGLPANGKAVVAGNQFKRTGGMPPLVAILDGSSAILHDNQLNGGGVATIMLAGEMTLIDNTLKSDQGRTGIFLRENAIVTSSGNTFEGYKSETTGPGVQKKLQ